MANVNIKFNGKEYLLSCEDGQEEHLEELSSNLSKKFKGYSWQKNFGYGTSQHLKAIKVLGITKHHRKNFSPINRLK